MQILEEKDVDFNRSESESDHMYYMSKNCLSRQNQNKEGCIVPFDSEESEDIVVSTTTENKG